RGYDRHARDAELCRAAHRSDGVEHPMSALMNNLTKQPRRVLVLVFLCLYAFSAFGANCLSNATGNWNAAATWTTCGGTFPGVADNATVRNGHLVTLTANASAASL